MLRLSADCICSGCSNNGLRVEFWVLIVSGTMANTCSAMVDWFEARPINQAMSDNMSQCVRARLDTIGIESIGSGANVRLLDYACGSGFLSRVCAVLFSRHGLRSTADRASRSLLHTCRKLRRLTHRLRWSRDTTPESPN
jgi:hypothetical protein